MLSFSLRSYETQLPGLTQRSFIGSVDPLSSLGSFHSDAITQVFTRTLIATATTEKLVVLGTGGFDVSNYIRIMTDYAQWTNQSMVKVADEFFIYLRKVTLALKTWSDIGAFLTGSSNKSIRPEYMIKIDGSTILAQISSKFPSPDFPVFEHLLADYLSAVAVQANWYLPGPGYVYRLRRLNTYPTPKDLVDAVQASELELILKGLDVNVGRKLKDLKEAKSLNANVIANFMMQSVARAWDIAKLRIDAPRVVYAVMSRLGKTFDSTLPDADRLPERILRANGFEAARGNIALFMCYQDMLRGNAGLSGIDWFNGNFVDYSDEEFTSHVMRTFYEAVMVNGPFKERMLQDTVSHIGAASALDVRRQPSAIALYERIGSEPPLSVFNRVHSGFNMKDDKQESWYLLEDADLTAKYAMGLSSIGTQFSVETMIRQKIDTLESYASNQIAIDTSLSVVFPSVLEAEMAAGRPASWLNAYLRGTFTAEEVSEDELQYVTKFSGIDQSTVDVVAPLLRRRAYDLYCALVSIAVAKGNPSVVTVRGDNAAGRPLTFLTWNLMTQYAKPLGNSTLMAQTVQTHEPIEALAYLFAGDTITPTSQLELRADALKNFEDHIHIWPWFAASSKVFFEVDYTVNLSGTRYSTKLTESDFYGTFYKKDTLRFMRPCLTTAVLSSWVALWLDDIRELEKVAQDKDSLISEAAKGRLLSVKLDMAGKLLALGNSPMASRAAAKIHSAIRDQLYALNKWEEYSAVHTVANRVRTQLRLGIWTAELLGVLNKPDVAAIIDKVVAPDVMSAAMAMMTTSGK